MISFLFAKFSAMATAFVPSIQAANTLISRLLDHYGLKEVKKTSHYQAFLNGMTHVFSRVPEQDLGTVAPKFNPIEQYLVKQGLWMNPRIPLDGKITSQDPNDHFAFGSAEGMNFLRVHLPAIFLKIIREKAATELAMRDENTALKSKLAELEMKNAAATMQLSDRDRQIDSLNHEQRLGAAQLAAVTAELATIKESFSAIQVEMASAKENMNQLATTLSQKSQLLTDLQLKNTTLTETLGQLRKEKSELDIQAKKREARLAEFELKLKDSERKEATYQDALEGKKKLRDQRDELQRQVAELQTEVLHLKKKIDRLTEHVKAEVPPSLPVPAPLAVKKADPPPPPKKPVAVVVPVPVAASAAAVAPSKKPATPGAKTISAQEMTRMNNLITSVTAGGEFTDSYLEKSPWPLDKLEVLLQVCLDQVRKDLVTRIVSYALKKFPDTTPSEIWFPAFVLSSQQDVLAKVILDLPPDAVYRGLTHPFKDHNGHPSTAITQIALASRKKIEGWERVQTMVTAKMDAYFSTSSPTPGETVAALFPYPAEAPPIDVIIKRLMLLSDAKLHLTLVHYFLSLDPIAVTQLNPDKKIALIHTLLSIPNSTPQFQAVIERFLTVHLGLTLSAEQMSAWVETFKENQLIYTCITEKQVGYPLKIDPKLSIQVQTIDLITDFLRESDANAPDWEKFKTTVTTVRQFTQGVQRIPDVFYSEIAKLIRFCIPFPGALLFLLDQLPLMVGQDLTNVLRCLQPGPNSTSILPQLINRPTMVSATFFLLAITPELEPGELIDLNPHQDPLITDILTRFSLHSIDPPPYIAPPGVPLSPLELALDNLDFENASRIGAGLYPDVLCDFFEHEFSLSQLKLNDSSLPFFLLLGSKLDTHLSVMSKDERNAKISSLFPSITPTQAVFTLSTFNCPQTLAAYISDTLPPSHQDPNEFSIIDQIVSGTIHDLGHLDLVVRAIQSRFKAIFKDSQVDLRDLDDAEVRRMSTAILNSRTGFGQIMNGFKQGADSLLISDWDLSAWMAKYPAGSPLSPAAFTDLGLCLGRSQTRFFPVGAKPVLDAEFATALARLVQNYTHHFEIALFLQSYSHLLPKDCPRISDLHLQFAKSPAWFKKRLLDADTPLLPHLALHNPAALWAFVLTGKTFFASSEIPDSLPEMSLERHLLTVHKAYSRSQILRPNPFA